MKLMWLFILPFAVSYAQPPPQHGPPQQLPPQANGPPPSIPPPPGAPGPQAANFANDLATCVNVKPINACLRETLEALRALMPVGIPELGLRPTEPFRINNLAFQSDPGLVDVRAQFSNVSDLVISTNAFL